MDLKRKEQLLVQVEELLRLMPSREAFGSGKHEEVLPWLGRAAAVLERWDHAKRPSIQIAVAGLEAGSLLSVASGFPALKTLLHQAQADLAMDVGSLAVVVPGGKPFAYFDQVRKLVAAARSEVFFVDPYLDADFVAIYFPHLAPDVAVRLLGRKRMPELLSAVEMAVRETPRRVEVRSSPNLHDRFVFVDRSSGHFSGASFKQGAQSASVLLAQVGDAFKALWNEYESLWASAKPERIA